MMPISPPAQQQRKRGNEVRGHDTTAALTEHVAPHDEPAKMIANDVFNQLHRETTVTSSIKTRCESQHRAHLLHSRCSQQLHFLGQQRIQLPANRRHVDDALRVKLGHELRNQMENDHCGTHQTGTCRTCVTSSLPNPDRMGLKLVTKPSTPPRAMDAIIRICAAAETSPQPVMI